MRIIIAAASLMGLALTAAGAVGAHVVGAGDPAWDAAILFGFVHVLAAVAASALAVDARLKIAAGWAFLAGTALFSFTLILRAWARVLLGHDAFAAAGPLTPIGGTAFMLGWGLLTAAALRTPRGD